MSRLHRQRGVALFTAIFLIVVIAAVAAAFALITVTQQTTSARALDAEGAYAAAMGRLDIGVAGAINDGDCPGTGDGASEQGLHGYTTVLVCGGKDGFDGSPDEISEGGEDYCIYRLRATAHRGDRRSGTLVRRQVQAQVVSDDASCPAT